MKIKKLVVGILSLTVVLLVVSSGQLFASTDEPLEDIATEIDISLDNTEDCIGIRSIKKTKILTNQRILFYVSGKKIYQSNLPKRCPGLRHNSIISYTLNSSRLCHQDSITVLRDNGGFGLSEGVSCRLGKFEEVPDLEALLEFEDQ